MHAFRLMRDKYAATPLDGEGARLVGGRWSPKGIPVAYCASSLSLAVLEQLVHVDPATLPGDLVAIELEIPEDLILRCLSMTNLPLDWRKETWKEALQAMGMSWVNDGNEVGLLVPSVIVPNEQNILLNSRHPDITKVRIVSKNSFTLDPRLF